METEQPMRIFCKEDPSLNVAARGDKLLLVPADPSDKSQHWIKDHGAVGKLTDIQGREAFALVNRTTGQAMVNLGDDGKVHQTIRFLGEVTLAPYSGHVAVELSKLWSLGEPDDDGFSNVRVLQSLYYILNARWTTNEVGKNIMFVATYAVDPEGAANEARGLWKIVGIDQE